MRELPPVLVLHTNADFVKPSRAVVQATCEKLCELPQTDVARAAARHGIVIPLGTRPTRKHFLDSFCHRLAYTMQQMALDTLKTILGGPANAVHVLVLVSLTDAVGNACSYPEFVAQSNIVHQVDGTDTGSVVGNFTDIVLLLLLLLCSSPGVPTPSHHAHCLLVPLPPGACRAASAQQQRHECGCRHCSSCGHGRCLV